MISAGNAKLITSQNKKEISNFWNCQLVEKRCIKDLNART